MYIKVSVRTGSKVEFVKEEGKDSLLIAVKEPAERGLANERVLEIIKERSGDGRKIIKIVSGHHSPHKIISVEEVK